MYVAFCLRTDLNVGEAGTLLPSASCRSYRFGVIAAACLLCCVFVVMFVFFRSSCCDAVTAVSMSFRFGVVTATAGRRRRRIPATVSGALFSRFCRSGISAVSRLHHISITASALAFTAFDASIRFCRFGMSAVGRLYCAATSSAAASASSGYLLRVPIFSDEVAGRVCYCCGNFNRRPPRRLSSSSWIQHAAGLYSHGMDQEHGIQHVRPSL